MSILRKNLVSDALTRGKTVLISLFFFQVGYSLLGAIFFKLFLYSVIYIGFYEIFCLQVENKKAAIVALIASLSILSLPFSPLCFKSIFFFTTSSFFYAFFFPHSVKDSSFFRFLFFCCLSGLVFCLFSWILRDIEKFTIAHVLICSIAVLSDFFGYCFGIVALKRRECIWISPKKTLEGYCGSFIGVLLTIQIFIAYSPYPEWRALAGFFDFFQILLLVFASLIGDLAFSLLKRLYQIKDYSSLLPGHGGILDRLDSIIFSLSAAYFLRFV